MCNDETSGFALGCPNKIYAIRVVSGRNAQIISFGVEFLNALPDGVVDADFA
jgi:hypothetical protein